MSRTLPNIPNVPNIEMVDPFEAVSEYQQIKALSDAAGEVGWMTMTACGDSSGRKKPLVGDHGKNFFEVGSQQMTLAVEVPTGATHFVLTGNAYLFYKVAGPVAQTIQFVLNRSTPLGSIAQTLYSVSAPTVTGGHFFHISGTLNAPLPVTGVVERGSLVITSTKTNARGNVANNPGRYWDGLFAFQLRFYRA